MTGATRPEPDPEPAPEAERPRVRILSETDAGWPEEPPPDRSDAFECVRREGRWPHEPDRR